MHKVTDWTWTAVSKCPNKIKGHCWGWWGYVRLYKWLLGAPECQGPGWASDHRSRWFWAYSSCMDVYIMLYNRNRVQQTSILDRKLLFSLLSSQEINSLCACLGLFLFPFKGTNCSDINHYKSIKWLEGRQSHTGQRKWSVGDEAEFGSESVLGFYCQAVAVWKETQMFWWLGEFVSHWAVTFWHF